MRCLQIPCPAPRRSGLSKANGEFLTLIPDIRVIGLAGCLWAAAADAFADEGYSVAFEGAPDALEGKLGLISTLAKGERALPTVAAVRRMALRDQEAIAKALTAAGHYAGAVDFTLVEAEGDDATLVTFRITAGPAFRITDYELRYADAGPRSVYGERPQRLADLGIEADGSAAGARLQALQSEALTALWNAGYPAARIVGRRAIADMSSGTARAVFSFESGPRATFGEAQIKGALLTEPEYLRKLRTWEEGEPFDRSKLVAYRDRLAATGVFGAIDVEPGAPDETGRAPVIVTVTERKRRTVGAGVSFSTAEGPGGRLFLEYRNMFGAGERSRVEIRGNTVAQSIAFNFDKPMPGLPGSLFAGLGFTNETTDAFNARTVNIGGGVAKRWLDDRLETRAALAFETSRITEDDVSERTYFLSAPLSAVWNTEDDPLVLSRGVRASLVVTPFAGTDMFTRTELAARSRVNFGPGERFTIAGRTRLGATFGSSLSDLPLNRRLYAGGGASVRGFDFQEAGPLDVDGDPVGGRSVIEGAVETRLKVTDNIQIAGFADAANISADTLPEFDGDYFVGVGGGARYFTPIGPIRVDFAIPLDRRETDSSFQLYISLGQSF